MVSLYRIIPKDWIELVKDVLEHGPQSQYSMWFREKARIIEQQNKARGREISQDQILGGDNAIIERQAVYDDHTLNLCCAAVLNAWDRIGEIGKKK